jgi:hypothetical protein
MQFKTGNHFLMGRKIQIEQELSQTRNIFCFVLSYDIYTSNNGHLLSCGDGSYKGPNETLMRLEQNKALAK